jgi:hypothetical protein
MPLGGTAVTARDRALIRSLEWLQLEPQQRPLLVARATALVRRFMAEGSEAAAAEVVGMVGDDGGEGCVVEKNLLLFMVFFVFCSFEIKDPPYAGCWNTIKKKKKKKKKKCIQSRRGRVRQSLRLHPVHGALQGLVARAQCARWRVE